MKKVVANFRRYVTSRDVATAPTDLVAELTETLDLLSLAWHGFRRGESLDAAVHQTEIGRSGLVAVTPKGDLRMVEPGEISIQGKLRLASVQLPRFASASIRSSRL